MTKFIHPSQHRFRLLGHSHYYSSFFILLVVLFAPLQSHAESEYSFGVFPYMPTQQTLKIYGPVASNFGEKLGAKVRLKTAANFAKFERNLSQEIYDIAVIQPFDYPDVVDKYNYLPVARMSEDLITEFIVRDDSGISSLQALKGKRIALASIRAANSQMGLAHLRKAGFNLDTDVTLTHHKSHESCLQQVWLKKAAACVTGRPMVVLFEKKRKVKFKILAETEVIPHVLYVAHKRLSQEQREKLLATILQWNANKAGEKLIKSMGFSGFTQAKDEHYEIMRHISREQSVGVSSKSKSNLTLGVFPYFPPKKMAQLYGKVPRLFSKVLNGKKVQLKTAKSFEQFNRNVKQNLYDIVLIQPFDYYQAISAGFKPVARVSGNISASIYVNKISPVQSLQQLRGKTVSMPPRSSAVSRLILKALQNENLWPGKDLILEYKNTHISCLRQIKLNISDACATAVEVLDMLPGELTNNIRGVYTTNAVPHLVLLASSSLSPVMIDNLSKEVISWSASDEGRSILKRIKLSAFIPFDEKEYRALKKF